WKCDRGTAMGLCGLDTGRGHLGRQDGRVGRTIRRKETGHSRVVWTDVPSLAATLTESWLDGAGASCSRTAEIGLSRAGLTQAAVHFPLAQDGRVARSK